MPVPANFEFIPEDRNFQVQESLKAELIRASMENATRNSAIQAELDAAQARNDLQDRLEQARLKAEDIRTARELASRERLTNQELAMRQNELRTNRDWETSKYMLELFRRQSDPEYQLHAARLNAINSEPDPKKRIALILGKQTEVSPDTAAHIAAQKELAGLSRDEKVGDEYSKEARDALAGERANSVKLGTALDKIPYASSKSSTKAITDRLEVYKQHMMPGEIANLAKYTKEMRDNFVGNQNLDYQTRDKYMWGLYEQIESEKAGLATMLDTIERLPAKSRTAAMTTYRIKAAQFEQTKSMYNEMRDKLYMKNSSGTPVTAEDLKSDPTLGRVPAASRPFINYFTPFGGGMETSDALSQMGWEAAEAAGLVAAGVPAANKVIDLFKSPQQLMAEQTEARIVSEGKGRNPNNVGLRNGPEGPEADIIQQGTQQERDYIDPKTKKVMKSTIKDWEKFYDQAETNKTVNVNPRWQGTKGGRTLLRMLERMQGLRGGIKSALPLTMILDAYLMSRDADQPEGDYTITPAGIVPRRT